MTTHEEMKLANCPFCGMPGVIDSPTGYAPRAACSDITCKPGRRFWHRIEEWNTRAPDPIKAELLEACRMIISRHDQRANDANFERCGCEDCETARTAIANATGAEMEK